MEMNPIQSQHPASMGNQPPALDMRAALQKLSGDSGLYRRLLDKFVECHADAGQRLSLALREGDIGLAQSVVHDMKGVSGILEARALQVAANELDTLLKQGLAPQGQVDVFLRALNELLDGLKRLRLNARHCDDIQAASVSHTRQRSQ